MNRKQTRRPVSFETIDLLREQVGVALELLRDQTSHRYGSVLADYLDANPRVKRDLGRVENNLLASLDTLRALRYDA
jgi:GrpB-like predicted nucleotidyltransferase (UPF0157 family)